MLDESVDLSQSVGGARIILLVVCMKSVVYGIIMKVKSMSLRLFSLAIKQYHKRTYFFLFYLLKGTIASA